MPRHPLRNWLPHPLLSLALLILWLLLNNSLGPGNILLGAILAVTLSRLTANFWPERPRLKKPLKLARFMLLLLWDILVANLQVARLILGPRKRLRPAFIELPLSLTDPFAITLLASVISLTPGTVSADLMEAARPNQPDPANKARPSGSPGCVLLIHSLDSADPLALGQQLKDRYEAPLLEIFG